MTRILDGWLHFIKKADEFAAPRMLELVTSANEINQGGVREKLKKYPQRSKHLYVVGGLHLDLPQVLYLSSPHP